jgi:hypothetical protein
MFGKIGLGVAVLLVSAMPALADAAACGDTPVPPALPSASDINHDSPADAAKAKHQAFLDVVHWQKSDLKTFRDCLSAATNDDNRKIAAAQQSGDKNAADTVAGLQADMTKLNGLYDASVDTEKRVVGEFAAISSAFCSRKDVDQATCPKQQ